MWIGLNCYSARTTNCRSQYCVTSNIGANIDKKIVRAQQMEQKRHISIFMEPTVDISRRSSHSSPDNKSRTCNPLEYDFAFQSAAHLPIGIPNQCPQGML